MLSLTYLSIILFSLFIIINGCRPLVNKIEMYGIYFGGCPGIESSISPISLRVFYQIRGILSKTINESNLIVAAIGFSTNKCLPFSNAIFAYSKWYLVGVTTSIASELSINSFDDLNEEIPNSAV